MAEQLDKYELERKIEKLEFQLENLTADNKKLKEDADRTNKIRDMEAQFSCNLEEKLSIALKTLKLCVSTYPMCDLREIKKAIKQIEDEYDD